MNAHVDEIRSAVRDCSERGLHAAARWAGEFLATPAVSSHSRLSDSAPLTSTPRRTPSRPFVPPVEPDTSFPELETDPYETDEADLHAVARTYFDAKELDRASHLLRGCRSARCRFLCVYAQYLASEKRAQDTWTAKADTRSREEKPINPELVVLLPKVDGSKEPFILFLRGIILSGLRRRAEAIECIIMSLKAYPWNWSCWQLLSSLIEDSDELTRIQPLLPPHPVTKMFIVNVMVELHAATDEVQQMLEELLQIFPASLHLMAQKALVCYHIRDFDQAEGIFDRILELDPHRIEEIDIFSNILYVMDKRAKLSHLAHKFVVMNKNRPEVCCLVGNYYSLRMEHEKAIKYFRRAVQLDQTYLAAWTLMGHEYVELKNSEAAIEAYRRAVDVNRKDYRAWYGLGQTYELLDMPQYALHYYQRATALRPYDIRMWQALGNCYRILDKSREAIECYKRALIGADQRDTAGHLQLAQLFSDIGQHREAAAYHQHCVEICKWVGKPLGEYAKSCIYVAKYEMSRGAAGDWRLAREYLEKVANSNVGEVTVAAELLRELLRETRERVQS
ncbi:hypothetical protein BOTBODRAFT_32144, partial [Botryobasidium botryosum FD-172 SS1]